MENKGTVVIRVRDAEGAHSPIEGARVSIYAVPHSADNKPLATGVTNRHGEFKHDLVPGSYFTTADAFGNAAKHEFTIKYPDDTEIETLEIPLCFGTEAVKKDNTPLTEGDFVTAGQPLKVRAYYKTENRPVTLSWDSVAPLIKSANEKEVFVNTN